MKEIRELLCMLCDREYPVWYTPNETWNAVMRWPDGREASEKYPFVCPTCFVNEATHRGVTGTGWKLSLERKQDLSQASPIRPKDRAKEKLGDSNDNRSL